MADDAERVRRAVVIARRVVREQAVAAIAARAELAQSAAVLGGWGLVTLGIAHVARPEVVWPVSAGVFLLAVCGTQFLGRLFWEGLYQITRGEG